MKITAGPAAQFAPALLAALWRYRYRVFVEMLGWPLDCAPGCERDQFDRDDTVHVIVQNDAHAGASGAIAPIVAYARLLPTVRPYLLADVFPQLLGGMQAPSDPRVWELSRFAAVDIDASGTVEQAVAKRFLSPLTMTLLRAALACAAANGAQRVITTSPLGIERLLRETGFHAERAGAPQRIGPDTLFACWIDCAPHASENDTARDATHQVSDECMA